MPRSTCPDGSPHRWILGDSDGGIIPAFCQKCEAERTFTNNVVDDWNGRMTATPRQTALMGGERWNGYDRSEGLLQDEVVR